MRFAFLFAVLALSGGAEAASFMRVDVTGTLDSRSSSFKDPLDVGVGDAFTLTGYFDLSVLPRSESGGAQNSYYNIGVAMVASLGSYSIMHGTPVAPVPDHSHVTYANASVFDIDPPSSSGIGFNFSATSAAVLGGFSPYYIAVSARDDDSAGLGDLLFTPDKFTAATLALMEETKVDFSLHNGSTVLRFEGEIDSWSASYVDALPTTPAVPLPATGLLLAGALAGAAGLRRRG